MKRSAWTLVAVFAAWAVGVMLGIGHGAELREAEVQEANARARNAELRLEVLRRMAQDGALKVAGYVPAEPPVRSCGAL